MALKPLKKLRSCPDHPYPERIKELEAPHFAWAPKNLVAYYSLETFIQPEQTRISEIFFLMRDCQGAGHVDDDYFDNT